MEGDARGTGPGVEKPSDFGSSVRRWDAELRAAERTSQKWLEEAKRISSRYTLEKRRARNSSDMGGSFNILWSNIQTLKPAVHSREPIPVVERRHQDQDTVGRIASQILERGLKTDLEYEERRGQSLDSVIGMVTLDMLLIARGVSWVRYEPDILGNAETGEMVADERSPIEFIHASDFLHSPKKNWAEVVRTGWVARRVYLTKEEGRKRFGDRFRDVPMTAVGMGHEKLDSMEERAAEVIGRCVVWEIWDAATQKVIWINRQVEHVLDERDDPLSLEGFFPCPEPVFGTLGNDSLVPCPDYAQYRTLAEELDRQTERIDGLTDGLRAIGIYDASVEGLGRILSDYDGQNKLVPVTNMSAITSKGSQGGQVSNVVQFFPLDTIASTLVGLYDARERTKQTLYEVSGIADVLRGVVDPREKLGQSQIKSQHAGQRIGQRQKAIENHARDLIRRKAEIMSEHYSPQLLRELSGYDQLPEVVRMRKSGDPNAMQYVEMMFSQAIGLLKSDRMRGFRVEIETNSTVMPDEQSEKQDRIEFLGAAGQFMEKAIGALQFYPQIAPLLGEMLLFTVRGFRTGRSLESAFEQAVENLQGGEGMERQQDDPQAQAPASGQKERMDAQQMQHMQQKALLDGQTARMKAAFTMQSEQAKAQATQVKAAADAQKAESDALLTQIEVQAKIAEIEAKMDALSHAQKLRERQALVSVAENKAGE